MRLAQGSRMSSSSRSRVVKRDDSLRHLYQHDLHFYDTPPAGEVLLTELQELSIERLRVLKLVERVNKTYRTRPIVERRRILAEELQLTDLQDYANIVNSHGCRSHSEEELRIRRKDHLSHFILRLAFAFQFEKKEWFHKQESILFQWRFSALDKEGIRRFIEIHGFCYAPISKEEKLDVVEYLEQCGPCSCNIHEEPFYKVPFIRVPSLVGNLEVFCSGGSAYVPESKLSYLFITHFQNNLAAAFERARMITARSSDDPRLSSVYREIPKRIVIERPTAETVGHVRLQELDQLSKVSYPLCMRRLHEALRARHHLTNGGRVQYLLFLKGIGVSISDTLELWRSEFSRVMSEKRFDARYKYNVLHLYGLVGKRADYAPFDCNKIMRTTLSPRDCHGCPFKHATPDELARTLSGYGLVSLDINEVVKLASDGLYNSACSRYYEIMNSCLLNKNFEHPNTYFYESWIKQRGDDVEAD